MDDIKIVIDENDTEITQTDMEDAEKGFNSGMYNANVVYKMTLEQVAALPMSEAFQTGVMMGFLEFFSRTLDNVLKQANGEASSEGETLQ